MSLNPVKLILISGTVLICGVIFGYVAFPRILKFAIKTVSLIKIKLTSEIDLSCIQLFSAIDVET